MGPPPPFVILGRVASFRYRQRISAPAAAVDVVLIVGLVYF